MKFRYSILALMLFSSCGLLLGVRNPYDISENSINKFNRKNSISNYYELNDSIFFSTYDPKVLEERSFDNLSQPLQLIVFDKNKQLICHLINCNIGGIPLKWNRYQSFDTVPVVPYDFLQPEYLVTLTEIQNLMIPKIENDQLEDILENYDYVYFVYYGIFLKGFAKPFLKYVQENAKLDPNKKVKVIYVNLDRFFYRNFK